MSQQVETTTDFSDTTTDIVSDSTEPAMFIQFTVNNGSNTVQNATPEQLENDGEDDEQDDSGHRKPEKPIHSNQVIVETNPINNINVEAPIITTIIGGHPYPGS